jgi:O-Antigen ligase
MANPGFQPRNLIILAIVLPLAVILGYLMATPDQVDSVVLISLVSGCLLMPLVLRWHHAFLIFAANASLTLSFLPGQPSLWVVLAGLSLGISVLERGLAKKEMQTYVPSIVWSLIFLAAITLITARLTGGLGLRAMGAASYGGKRYFLIFAAIIVYFALTSQRVPVQRAARLASVYFISSLTAIMSNIIYLLGPSFYFLYLVFPSDLVWQQVQGEFAPLNGIIRLTGFAFGGPAMIYVLLLNYGLRGVISMAHPWRLLGFVLCLAISLLGGFRSSLVMLAVLLVVQFFLEGLHRTRLVLPLSLAALLISCAVLPFARQLPMPVQRSLSFLPIDVDPVARYDAEASTEWRLEMWRVLWPQVPQYLLLGKGCSLDPSEMYLLQYSIRQGFCKDMEESLASGAYHSGPLTILIQFGGFAALGFLWFVFASLRVLYRHYQNSPPELLCDAGHIFSGLLRALC